MHNKVGSPPSTNTHQRNKLQKRGVRKKAERKEVEVGGGQGCGGAREERWAGDTPPGGQRAKGYKRKHWEKKLLVKQNERC